MSKSDDSVVPEADCSCQLRIFKFIPPDRTHNRSFACVGSSLFFPFPFFVIAASLEGSELPSDRLGLDAGFLLSSTASLCSAANKASCCTSLEGARAAWWGSCLTGTLRRIASQAGSLSREPMFDHCE